MGAGGVRRAGRGGKSRPAGPAGIVFSPNTVKTEAKRLSDQPFSKPAMELPKPFDKLSYDQYRDIRFRPEKAIWKDDHLDFQVQPFAMGWLYDMPVDLWTVENGTATRLIADSRLFSFGPLIGPGPDAAPYGFSGFRIHGPINRADYFDEYAVFQGASYLRAVGRDEGYGASARGLALNTARPGGEEFPFFPIVLARKAEARCNRNCRPCVAGQPVDHGGLSLCDRAR